jgi:hypothetical protein
MKTTTTPTDTATAALNARESAERLPQEPPQETEAAETFARLREIAQTLNAKPFRPHPVFRSGHAQTLLGFVWPRRRDLRAHVSDESRLFEVEPGVRVLAHCRWQSERTSRPTLVLLHGLEGSSASVYILGSAHLAYQTGFNVVRVNMRNCGSTEHLTPTLYHSGMSGDIRAVVCELAERDKLPRIFVAGFSMGGNIVLKMAGEMGDHARRELRGVCAVSPALNLGECADRISEPSNWLYHQSFMRSLRRRIRHKTRLYPTLYDTNELRRVRTIRDFDNRYTSVQGGYANAEEYYARASSISLVAQIRTPTLIVHAQDDPLVPFASFTHPSLSGNPYIIPLLPPHGGHVAFVAATDNPRERFWAESRLVEFCRLLDEGEGVKQ